jgi:DNA-binding NarL/FixJ family response regulator
MSPLEAKKIIESLSNGIDPETGEILPEQSTFNSPQIIRALFVAGKALDSAVKRAARNSSLPGNAGRAWSDEEDKELLSIFDTGTSVKDIAERHGRTQGAIAARLVRLGRIKDRADVYAGAHPITTPYLADGAA